MGVLIGMVVLMIVIGVVANKLKSNKEDVQEDKK